MTRIRITNKDDNDEDEDKDDNRFDKEDSYGWEKEMKAEKIVMRTRRLEGGDWEET